MPSTRDRISSISDPNGSNSGQGPVCPEHVRVAKDIERLENRMATVEHYQSDTASMFNKILLSSREIANQIVALDGQMKDSIQAMWNRLAEQRRDLQANCDIRHHHVDRRIDKLEEGDERIERKVEDMSEISKIHMIQDLKSQVDEYKKQLHVVRVTKTSWRKYWISIIVGIIMCILGATTTYWVNVATHRATQAIGGAK